MNKLLCFDIDGTISIDDKLIDGAKELFLELRRKNIKYVFITNNSSKSINTYVEKLNKMGIEVTKENFYTSVEVTINYLRKFTENSIFIIGTNDFKQRMAEYFTIIEDEKTPDYVVLGFDTELRYEKLVQGIKHINNGAKFIATNPDLRCPVSFGYIPDCGAIAHLIEVSTGVKPLFLGKPNKHIILDLVKKFNVKKENTYVIGDRLYTDILSGINSGTKTIAVLSGETSLDEISKSDIKPNYIINHLSEIIDIIEGEKDVQ